MHHKRICGQGPGDDFYPTARLIHGETLELWSVSESGYGAVRPLTGSFSWLRAADVDREIENDPKVGVVVTDGASLTNWFTD